jgi:hypothetical protein
MVISKLGFLFNYKYVNNPQSKMRVSRRSHSPKELFKECIVVRHSTEEVLRIIIIYKSYSQSYHKDKIASPSGSQAPPGFHQDTGFYHGIAYHEQGQEGLT